VTLDHLASLVPTTGWQAATPVTTLVLSLM